jgi:hypothetical protein
LFSRLTLHAYAALDYLTFHGDSTVAPRNDLDISGNLGADFEAFRWWIISLSDGIIRRSSSQSDPTLNYTDDQVLLTFRFIY